MKITRISDTIRALEEKMREHGDILVCLDDPDTGWLMNMEIEYAEEDKNGPARLEFDGGYGEDRQWSP